MALAASLREKTTDARTQFLAGVVTAAVAMSGVALTAGSAAATTDPQPDDTRRHAGHRPA